MNVKFSENLFLTNKTGKYLFEAYAKDLPIIDYHCHLQPRDIYENKVFGNIGEMWLSGDHYKWRAMRTFGIDEKYITGPADYHEKYLAFAGIFPKLAGNPLYIWCALELKRYFGIDEPLCAANAEDIYSRTKAIIKEKSMSPRWCIEHSNVKVASTTEDPADPLEYHIKLLEDSSFKTKLLSAFRPDKAFYCEKPGFAEYLGELSDAAGTDILSFEDVLAALEARLVYFKTTGTMISDHGIEEFNWRDYSDAEIEAAFAKAASGKALSAEEADKYHSAFLTGMGKAYARHGFVMQLHIGTYQDANTGMVARVGKSTGYDCTDDSTRVKSVGRLLDTLSSQNCLPKTILYALNPGLIELLAVLAAGFCEGPEKARVQIGAPWWFNDNPYWIRKQFEAAANLYPMSLSVGMLTDSRSFLSYSRHELYRRVLCDYLGGLVERGEYFSGEEALKEIIEGVCYYNAKEYFGL